MHSDPSGLRALGTDTKYRFDGPHAALLESFPNPAKSAIPVPGSVLTLHIEAPEFTSLCPMTGQPDFATIVIDYEPDALCVESKALKLYLGSFRMAGEFHEACVQRIGRDLIALLDPVALRVEGQFTPRGGIPFWPTFTYRRPSAFTYGGTD
jgi:7-cyano-7-deazaguanine reductase